MEEDKVLDDSEKECQNFMDIILTEEIKMNI